MKTKHKLYNGINLLKFVCANLIIIIHVLPFGSNQKYETINFIFQNFIARIAMPIFFISTGFLIYSKVKENKDYNIAKNYSIKLIKLYLIWSIIYLPLNIINYIKNDTSIKDAIINYIQHFLFRGSCVHLWYLTAAAFAVYIISILLKKNIKPKTILIISIILYIIGIFTQSLAGITKYIFQNNKYILDFLHYSKEVIITTQNGLFVGMIFVSIGMYIAYRNIKINKIKNIIMLFTSIILMSIEVYIIHKYKLAIEYNIYLFLPLVTYFIFQQFKNNKIISNNNSIFLKKMSIVMYLSHIWIRDIMDNFLLKININVFDNISRYIIILSIVILFSLIIVKYFDKHKIIKRIFNI